MIDGRFRPPPQKKKKFNKPQHGKKNFPTMNILEKKISNHEHPRKKKI